MGELTNEQKDFLRKNRISLGDVFDASGMRKKEYMTAMEEVGKHFAFGVTPCTANGHTLRTKAGHCIQCDTSRIAYAKRYSEKGIVYIAGSIEKKLIKIGVASDKERRLVQIRHHAYGGASDWELLASCATDNAGRIEFDVHEQLKIYSQPGSYLWGGRVQSCYELFRCSYAAAKSALIRAALDAGHVRSEGNERRNIDVYDF